jgi:hypothetical protein
LPTFLPKNTSPGDRLSVHPCTRIRDKEKIIAPHRRQHHSTVGRTAAPQINLRFLFIRARANGVAPILWVPPLCARGSKNNEEERKTNFELID